MTVVYVLTTSVLVVFWMFTTPNIDRGRQPGRRLFGYVNLKVSFHFFLFSLKIHPNLLLPIFPPGTFLLKKALWTLTLMHKLYKHFPCVISCEVSGELSFYTITDVCLKYLEIICFSAEFSARHSLLLYFSSYK
jgi:hypothetical protein